MLKDLFGGRNASGGGKPSGLPATLDPDSAYALWAPTYPARPHNKLMEVEQAAMLELLADVAGKVVLDAGCGTGRYLDVLRSRKARAIGIDRSNAMLSRATTASSLIRADLYALPLEASSVDAVVCGLALGDVSDLALAISEFARVLRPGGQLVYSVVHPDGGPAGWTRSFETAGGQWQVSSHWHSRAGHEGALASAHFAIEAAREPVVNGQRVALVVAARKKTGTPPGKVGASL
jgi:malonyl-CoA O-methyltransferase